MNIRNHATGGRWMAAALVFAMLCGCGGQAKKSEAFEAAEAEDSVATWDVEQIKDNAGDKLMPRALFPDASDALIDSLSLQDGVPSSVSAFWVEAPDGSGILFDTGLGAPDSRLLKGLEAEGVAPSDVEYLYLTHLHGDHIGGMLRGDTVVFPRAEVYASRAENEAWMQMPAERKAQVEKTMEAYKADLHLFEFGDTLPGGVVALEAVGHTPGHTVYQLGKLLIVGDLMHGLALQKDHPEICATYDMDKAAAIASRKRIMQYASDNDMGMTGMHFPAEEGVE